MLSDMIQNTARLLAIDSEVVLEWSIEMAASAE
jgi:hypothetical protein